MQQNEKLVRELYDAFATGDMPALDRLFADAVSWHAPGRGRHAGVRKGKKALFTSMGALAELTGGTLRSEIHDIVAGGDHVVVLQRMTGKRKGFKALDDREAIVYHLRDGKIVEVWEHPGDLYAMDEFFA